MTGPRRPTEGRTLDMSSLKGLAHPLRVRILDTLSTYGSFTASGLADRLGESSGATSYHLRQLEKHGFVREDEARGTGRERWWERTPDGISLIETDFPPQSAERSASQLVTREWQVARDALLADFIAHGSTVLAKQWYEASTMDTANMRLTADQLHALVSELQDVVESYSDRYKKQEVPGSRPVQIQLNAFPVMDAEEIPQPDPTPTETLPEEES
jgi:DNA-binding transcriptional ArsR family regulator